MVLRSEALKQGLSRYFTGVPCPKGHVADRWTSTSSCVMCAQETRDRIRSVEQKQVSVATRLVDSTGVSVLISRADAKKRGFRRYYTGEECNHGHIAERMVSNYRCIVCLQAAAKPYIHANHKRRKKTDPDFKRKWDERIYIAQRKLLQSDPVVRIRHALRSRISMLVRGKLKQGSAIKDLGCSIEMLRYYLESQFVGAMNWSNYGTVWEVDHVNPLAKFDLTDPVQFQDACHYTNLQPLLPEDNRKKSDMSSENWLTLQKVNS